MAWYYWLLIIVICSAIMLFVGYLWARKGSKDLVNRSELEKSKQKAIEEERKSQEKEKAELKQIAIELDEKQRRIDLWFEQAKQQIQKEQREEYEKLRDNHSVLDSKLDELLR